MHTSLLFHNKMGSEERTCNLNIHSKYKRALSQENLSSGFATRVDSKWPPQVMRLTRVLKFWI